MKVVLVLSFQLADPSLLSEFLGDSVIGVHQIAHIDKVVNSLFSDSTFSLTSNEHPFITSNEHPSLDLPKIRKDEGVEIIPIALGCKGACTFCQTRFARGELWSYPIDDILQRVHDCKVSGIPEIWLTGEDTGAYGMDRGTTLLELLENIKEEVRDSVCL